MDEQETDLEQARQELSEVMAKYHRATTMEDLGTFTRPVVEERPETFPADDYDLVRQIIAYEHKSEKKRTHTDLAWGMSLRRWKQSVLKEETKATMRLKVLLTALRHFDIAGDADNATRIRRWLVSQWGFEQLDTPSDKEIGEIAFVNGRTPNPDPDGGQYLLSNMVLTGKFPSGPRRKKRSRNATPQKFDFGGI